jgi:RimJ/RimL family protein N-acetyltransferase
MMNINATKLQGNHVVLEPLQPTHENELYVAAQDQAIWTYTGSKAYGPQFKHWFDSAYVKMSKNQHIPFAVRRLKDNKIVGSTRYYDIESEHKRLTIGYTWYIPETWGTVINPECKYLLLKNAFELLQMNRVEFCTDVRNVRARAAIRKIGATEEGVLRNHMITTDGVLRNTVVFSIINSEWPTVKSALEQRIQNLM